MYECGVKDCLHTSRKRAIQCNRMELRLTAITKLNQAITELKAKLAFAADEHIALKAKVAEAATDTAKVVTEKEAAEAKAEALQMSLNGANGQSKKLEGEVKTAKTVIAGFKEALEAANAKIFSLEKSSEARNLTQEQIDAQVTKERAEAKAVIESDEEEATVEGDDEEVVVESDKEDS